MSKPASSNFCDGFPLSNPSVEIPQLLTWARQAGQIALHHFKNVETIRHKPDHSFLTQADLEVEHFLVERIRAAYPNLGLISEERARVDKDGSSPSIWVIDPLDGTTAFSQGLPGWGIAIGLLHRGQPCFGLFYMPLLDDMTYTTGFSEVYSNGCSLRQATRLDWDRKGFLAIIASAHRNFQISVPRTRAMGSVGANLVYVARGAATAAFLPKPRLWDLVAGAAILARAGGELRYLSGQSVDYPSLLDGRQVPEPIIAGHPRLLAELQAAIRPRTSDAPQDSLF